MDTRQPHQEGHTVAKHRAPVVKRQRVRRTLRVLGNLPFRGLVLVGRGILSGPRAALWLARGLAQGTLGLAWLVVTSALILVASLAGKYGGELRNMIIKHLLEPFGKRAQQHTNPSPVPSKGKAKAKAKPAHTNPSTLPVDTDPDPALWPDMDNSWGIVDHEDDDHVDSLGIQAIKGLR